MSISGIGTETYLYINGLTTSEEIKLNDNKVLLPAPCELPFDILSKSIKSDIDYSIAVLFGKSIGSQLKIIADNPHDLAVIAWNSQWDIILLNAILNCEATWNLQCTNPIDEITESSTLSIANYHVHGLGGKPCVIGVEEVKWLRDNFNNAQSLMDDERFSTAVHSLASYRWHSLPRVQLAILWMGIESLFEINSELVFRISLYTAKFLENNNEENALAIFNDVKRLYKSRSSAVHGGNIKGDLYALVNESSMLLNKLVKKCIEKNELPNHDRLIF